MSKLYEHLKNDSNSIRLSHAEKEAMRMRLERALFDAPVQPAPMQSPYMWMFAPRSLALAGLLVVLVGTSGTAYAAEGSLPGAPLYSVKTKVIEPIKVALAPSPAAKAEANARIAVERVREAQTLAAQGTLTEETAVQISNNYRVHADAALALAIEVSGDASVVSTVNTQVTSGSQEDAVGTTLAMQVDSSATNEVSAPTPTQAKTFSAKISLTSNTTVSSTSTSTSTAKVTATTNAVAPAKSLSTATSRGEAGSAASSSTTLVKSSTSSKSSTSTRETLVQKLQASLLEQDRILEGINAEVKQKRSERRNRDR